MEKRTTDGGTLELRLEFKYDSFNRRIEEARWTSTTGTVVTRFGFDGINPWAELDGSNALTMRRLFGDGVDELVARVSGAGTAGWYYVDRQGSVRLNVSAAGVVLNKNVFGGFGQLLSESNPSAADAYKYTGKAYQGDSGIQWNVHRWYDTRTGRWLTVDPDHFSAGDYNLYRYVHNSPTNFTDPYGLYERPPRWAVKPTSEAERSASWIKATIDWKTDILMKFTKDIVPDEDTYEYAERIRGQAKAIVRSLRDRETLWRDFQKGWKEAKKQGPAPLDHSLFTSPLSDPRLTASGSSPSRAAILARDASPGKEPSEAELLIARYRSFLLAEKGLKDPTWEKVQQIRGENLAEQIAYQTYLGGKLSELGALNDQLPHSLDVAVMKEANRARKYDPKRAAFALESGNLLTTIIKELESGDAYPDYYWDLFNPQNVPPIAPWEWKDQRRDLLIRSLKEDRKQLRRALDAKYPVKSGWQIRPHPDSAEAWLAEQKRYQQSLRNDGLGEWWVWVGSFCRPGGGWDTFVVPAVAPFAGAAAMRNNRQAAFHERLINRRIGNRFPPPAPHLRLRLPPPVAPRATPGPGWGEPWTPPKHWNGPKEHGKWTGPRGNSSWVDDRPEVIRIVGRNSTTGGANPIIFYKGRFMIDQYKQAEFRVPGVKGGRASRNADTKLIYKAIFKREGLGKPSEAFSWGKHREVVTEWLKKQPDGFGGTGLRPHHAGGDRIQYQPADLHKIQHTDMDGFIPPD